MQILIDDGANTNSITDIPSLFGSIETCKTQDERIILFRYQIIAGILCFKEFTCITLAYPLFSCILPIY